MLRTITVQSDGQDEAKDVEILLQERMQELRELAPSVAIVFTSHLEGNFSELLQTLKSHFPACQIVGCTTDGELSLEHPSCRDTVQITFMAAQACDMVAGAGRNFSQNPVAAVQEALETARGRTEQQPQLAVALLDGLSGIHHDIAAVLRQGVESELGTGFPVVGGSAGDRFLIQKTWQFLDGEVLEDAVVLLLFCGPVLFATHTSHGRRPIGSRCGVAGVEANVVREIGGQPALRYYASNLGDNPDEYRQFPLMVHPADGSLSYLCSAGFFNEEDDSVMFVGAFPEDVQVQFCEADRGELVRAAHESSARALEKYPGQRPQACMVFSCASRRHILGTWADQEMDWLRQNEAAPNAFGFYTYGEIGPDNERGMTRFHSDTFITLLLGEDA